MASILLVIGSWCGAEHVEHEPRYTHIFQLQVLLVESKMPTTVKPRTTLDETDDQGNLQRTAAAFDRLIEVGGRFAPEANRYHLYVALGCPWANGTLACLFMKGLEHVISYSIVHPTWARTKPNDPEDEHCGWHFRKPGDPPVPNPLGYGANVCDDALIPDTVNRCATLRGVYEKADDQSGKYDNVCPPHHRATGNGGCTECHVVLGLL